MLLQELPALPGACNNSSHCLNARLSEWTLDVFGIVAVPSVPGVG